VTIKERAREDVRILVHKLGAGIVMRHVGFFECAKVHERQLKGRARSRYQRAFHKALKET